MEYYDYDAWERNNYRDDEYDEYDNSDYEYDCYKDNLLNLKSPVALCPADFASA